MCNSMTMIRDLSFHYCNSVTEIKTHLRSWIILDPLPVTKPNQRFFRKDNDFEPGTRHFAVQGKNKWNNSALKRLVQGL